MFYSAFISTTSRCAFDNYENMMRLRESIQGKARTYVESLLIHEESVSQVVSNLKIIYGRDDQIIFFLIKKVKFKKIVLLDFIPLSVI
uniref:Uncharacterized protein n=1 Tax=Megaselia scalaris TaxID=36166 RepID=T1H593_MEGSC